MRVPSNSRRRGFTLIEIMVALALFGLVLTAIYACWTLILKSSKVGLEAAARIQRERVALRTIEEALGCVRSYQASLTNYYFAAENGDGGYLSFVAQLPESFPRSGRFGDFDVRRVTFALTSGGDGERQLVLRQQPILMDMDSDEKEHPLVLAKGVTKMDFEFWDERKKNWVQEWTATNQLPKMLKLTMDFSHRSLSDPSSQPIKEEVARIIHLPSAMVPAGVQSGSSRPGQPNQPPVQQPNPQPVRRSNGGNL